MSGYLTLAKNIYENKNIQGNAYNFGPKSGQNKTVLKLIEDLSTYWNTELTEPYKITDQVQFYEAGLLKLNCEKSLLDLKWESTLDFQETVSMIGDGIKKILINQMICIHLH